MKRLRNVFKSVVMILLVLVIFSSCVSSTRVRFDSNPQGAEVLIDGRSIGKTPTEAKISNALGKNNPSILLKKDGYEDLRTGVDHDLQMTNLVCGLLLWWPSLFYVQSPKEYQNYILRKIE